MRLVFITNILTPYRITFYSLLNKTLVKRNDRSKLFVYVMTDQLPLRSWTYDALRTDYTHLLRGKKFFINEHDIVINKNIKNELKESDPDILIMAGSWTYPTVLCISIFRSFFLKRKTKLLFWYESHDNASDYFRAKSLDKGAIKWLKQHFMSRFDGFCVPGDLAKLSVSRFVKDKPIIYLRNIVDGEYYLKANELRKEKKLLRVKYGLGASSTIIFMPARLIKLKGIEELLSRISEDIILKYNFEFVLAGEGDRKTMIERVAKDKGIDIKLLGYQKQDAIRDLLAASDFFCLSSLTDANPLSAVEAAWAGLPLIMSKYTGNYPELIDEGKNGFVFDPLNVESVNTTILKALTKDEMWKEEARKTSVKIAKTTFDEKQVTESFLNQVETL